MNSFNAFQSISMNSIKTVPLSKANITSTVTPTTNGLYTVYTFESTTLSNSITFSNVSGTIPLNILAVGGGGAGGYNGGGGAGGCECA